MDSTEGAQQEGVELATLTYEAATEQLEAILASLETGELSLEESLAHYERGAALANYCEQKLDEAELRVRQWQPDGETKPFTGWQDENKWQEEQE